MTMLATYSTNKIIVIYV